MAVVGNPIIIGGSGGGGGRSATLGTKSISANGTYQASSDSLDGYSEVSVNVANSYVAGDEGKVVSNGALVAQTSVTKTANGTYDTTLNNEVIVNVPSSGGGTIIGFPVVKKYAEDVKRGYIYQHDWIFSTSDTTRCDVWEVIANHRYIVVLNATVGNRFRSIFTTNDITTYSSNFTGTKIFFKDSPNQYSIGGVQSEAIVNAFLAPSNGYIVVAKTNADITDIPCYLVDVTDEPTDATPSGGGGMVEPDYQGLAYAYISTAQGFHGSTTKNNYIILFPVIANHQYIIYLGSAHDNRYRVHFYSGKTISDFEQYIDNASADTSSVYMYTDNISGTTDLNNYSERYIFTPNSDGMIIVGTSNQSNIVPAYCIDVTP